MSRPQTENGFFNYCGKNIRKLRTSQIPPFSQRVLAEKMQLINIDMDKNAIQRIEAGQRSVSDVELVAFAKIFAVSVNELLKTD